MFIFIILPLPTLSRGFHKSRAGWKLWLSQGKRNRDTGLILPWVLFFLLLWTRKSPAFKRKILKAGLFLYVIPFHFDGFKKSEGKFLLLELDSGKLFSGCNRYNFPVWRSVFSTPFIVCF